jgi:pyruvate/2-oxoglutarate dehydrogenase complex dihydrolipoamide acyltransferase (E2) component
MIKLIDLLEEKMTPAQKKKRGEIFDKLVAGGMAKNKAGAIATSKAMSEKLDPIGQEDADIDNDGDTDKTDKYLINRRKAIAKNLKEGDHEVSMAVSSLEAIAEAIVELRQKLGNTERNIPGWIQDHIAKAENYIEQAAQGFHELKNDEMNEQLKRMQQLAGMLNENDQPGIYFDIEQDLMHGEFESTDDQIEYLQDVINFCNSKIAELQANG